MENGARGSLAGVVVHKLADGSAGGGEEGTTVGVMLHLAGCFDRSEAASPEGHLSGEERTHVKDLLQGRPSPAPGEASCKGKLVESQEEDRHQGRPGVPEDGGGGVLVEGEAPAPEPPATDEADQVDCGRERLKRHRVAMAGRVWIPESWGQEKLLKDWSDCAAIDRALVPTGLLSAREALVEELPAGQLRQVPVIREPVPEHLI